MRSKVTILGHPIHPMLVAYPVAFYTATLAAYSIYGATGDGFWLKLGIATNVAAVGMAVIAAIPGLIDWAMAIPRESTAKGTGLSHMIFNVLALVLFSIALGIYAPHWNDPTRSATAGMVLGSFGVAMTVIAGFMGWKLVQDHHVGIRLAPEQERLDSALDMSRMRRTG